MENKTKSIYVRIDEEDFVKLKTKSAKQNKTISQLIRDFVKNYIKGEK